MTNRFYQGFCLNTGNPSSHFRSFDIVTEREITDYEGGFIIETVKNREEYFDDTEVIGEPFYAVYGSFKIDFVQSSFKIMITDKLEDAISLVEHLTGNKVSEYYYD
ncbi:hypothetical protein EBU24_01380 [bacterium]|nr:hypothetical protein [bacterium]